MKDFDYKKYLAEGRLYEESIPSGWEKIDTSNDYEEEERQGRLMGFEAPMNGIKGDEVDNIYIEQDGDEYEVHIMTAFNNPEYKGPFNSKEEALKVAIQKMEDLKKDWDEKDLAEGKLFEEDFKNPILDKYLELKKSIDYKTVFPTDLQSFLDSLDNTEREGLKRDLAENKLLNEAELTDDLVQRVAQAIADEFTAEDNELDLKYVITPNSIEADPRGGGFDLDVEAGPNTPGDDWKDSRGFGIANYLGDYAGGSFVIRPEGDGYLVTNAASRNAKVAYITPEGEIEIISAEDSRADLGMTDDVETDYMERRKEMSDYMEEGEEENKNELKSNKMKKSELKEMIKSAFLNEKETFDQAFDRIDKEEEVYPGSDKDSVKEEEEENVEVNDEENVDVNVEDDVEVDVDDESVETDTVVKTELPGEDAEVTKTLGLLTKAQQTAKALGDDKLTDQIGNTITYFTRAHVARQQTNEVKVNEVTFPMWSKINK